MPEYKVMWEIDVEADSHEEAAGFAKNLQLDLESTANFFVVTDEQGNTVQVEVINAGNIAIH